MAAFIDRSGLSRRAQEIMTGRPLRGGYNGPAFHRNAYDTRLKAAYLRHAGRVGGDEIRVLRTGAKGEDVRQLQTALGRHGLPPCRRRLFGSATETIGAGFSAAVGPARDGHRLYGDTRGNRPVPSPRNPDGGCPSQLVCSANGGPPGSE